MNTKAKGTMQSIVALAMALTPVLGLQAQEGGGIGDALTSGKAGIQVRARYENVDQDNITEKADALTARFRLNYRTGQWNGWSGFAEFDHVFHLIDDFNSGAGTSPNRGQYPVVADPEGSDLNQLYLDYAWNDDSKARGGRQRILLDNQRFVGGVGWRQNEQTYDALTITSSAISNLDFQYSYVANVRRIFGERVAAGSDKSNHHLLNAKWAFNDNWSVVPYVYLLDYAVGDLNVPFPDANDVRRALSSTSTYGARVAGKVTAGEGSISLTGEYARQSDFGDNPAPFDADYLRADVTWAMQNGLSLGLSYESLGSDGGVQAFRTPLATLHAFQGWADRFLATPAAGINDVFVTGKFKAGKWSFTGVYHDFSAETGSEDYGKEFDVSAAYPLADGYALLFKGAFFSGDSASFPDTNKFWIMLTASY